MVWLQVITITLVVQQLFSQQFFHQPLTCTSQVQFVNRTADGWHGNLALTPPADSKGASIEVTFDDFVTAFVNNFAHSTTRNHRVFNISDTSKTLKAGKKLNIGFFAKFRSQYKIPLVIAIKFNNKQICPEVADEPFADDIVDTRCVKVEVKDGTDAGRWDGVLTVHPQVPRNGIRVDIELDEPAWALGNDLGDTKTSNQKRFSIVGRRQVRPGKRLLIKFFVKFDEFEETPKVKAIYIDGVPVCIAGATSRPVDVQSSGQFSTDAPKGGGIRLNDLPFDRFPSVTSIPAQVNNANIECGLSANSINNRFNGGSEAGSGEFPFHAAIFREQIYICGGSLVSAKTVVTAAHCVVDDSSKVLKVEDFRLLLGSYNLANLSGDEALREVSEIVKHPNYQRDTVLKQDIALMTIKGNLQLSPLIRPICLYESQMPIANILNQKGTVLGFGSNEDSREPSRTLNHGQMSIISRQQCIESKLIFGLLPEDSAFCAKAVTDMIACPGDSGGGLIFESQGKYFLRGISSITITDENKKCDPKASVAFTDVSFFLTWIQQNMK